VLAAVAAPFLIPVDSYRPLLVWAIESATGRDVQIDALKLSLLPTVHITVVNFRMKNPPGFPAGDALVASSVDLGIVPQALLSRRLEITYITPSGVQLNVLRNAAGRTNFATTAPTNTPVQKPAAVFTLEHVGAVTVNDAAITFADALSKELPAPAFSLRGVSGTIGSIDPQAADWAKKLAIVADLRGARLTLSNLTNPIDFHTGKLTIKGEAARGTFSLSVGTIDLAGAAAFARLDPLVITFAATGPELDFKTLATFLNGAHGRTAPAAARRLLAHGTIAIGKVIFSPFTASQLKGQLDLYTSAVRLNAWTISAYGGTVRGNAELDGSTDGPVTVAAQARGLNVARMLAAIGSSSAGVTGALDANFQLTTLLARDPEQSLTTTGTFAVRNGSFPSSAFQGLNLSSADTRFSSFGGDLRIARERGYSNRLTLIGTGMQATLGGSFGFDRTLQYNGTGVLDSVTAGTSLIGSPLLASAEPILAGLLPGNLGAAGVSAPFSLRGTLDRPQFALTGKPQLVTSQSSVQAVQQPAQTPSVQDLINLIPGR
jgi:uncharacterized protein involved in outer membrane biogenesis